MNLLYLHAHDLGRWIAPCGHAVDTPNLSALAGSSGTVHLSNAHSAAPTCSPSRAALLTGMSPHQAGMMGLMHRGFRLRDPRKHLACFLRESGFETALSGIQHILPGDALTGYASRFKGVKSPNEEGSIDWKAYDESVAESAAGFLEGAGEAAPFFLDCGFWQPHRPFPEPDTGIDPEAVDLPEGVADSLETRHDMAGFMTAVRHMDHCCGIVLDALARSRHADDTLVVFTTDHGPAFPGYKCNLTGKGTGVALMLRIPGHGGLSKTDALVSQLDLFPTFCDFLDLVPPDWLDGGNSLRPLIGGETNSIRDAVFAEVTYHAGYEPMRSVRTRDHSLIRIFEDDLAPVPANVDDSAMKDELIASGWLTEKREAVQLFDLQNDPGETRNLADDPAFAAVRTELEAALTAQMEKTNDPLLAGPVPIPEGGYANDRDHLSPTIGEA